MRLMVICTGWNGAAYRTVEALIRAGRPAFTPGRSRSSGFAAVCADALHEPLVLFPDEPTLASTPDAPEFLANINAIQNGGGARHDHFMEEAGILRRNRALVLQGGIIARARPTSSRAKAPERRKRQVQWRIG